MNLSTISQLYDHPIIRSADESGCEGFCITRWKIIFGFLLFLEGMFFGHLVFLIRRFKSRKGTESGSKFNTIIQFGNAVAAGVFFGTGFLHILPEAIALLSGEHGHEEESHEEESHVERNADDHEGEEEGEHHEEEEEEGVSFPTAFAIVMGSFYLFFFLEKILLPKLFGSKIVHGHGEEHIAAEAKAEDVEQTLVDTEGEKSLNHEQSRGFSSKFFIMGLLQILGISAHSFIESMALGVSSNFSLALNIFIATISHRWATTVALSFPLVRDLSYFPFLVLLLIFSAMIPLGIGIGAALSNISSTVQGVLFSVSAGTFLYMGAYELIVDSFIGQPKRQFEKFIAMLAGASIILIITGILTALDIHG